MAEIDTFEDLLERIRETPGMYARNLADLECMFHGYSTALNVHDIHEFGRNFNQRFSEFLSQELGLSLASGWAYAISEGCNSDQASFDRFFELLERFREAPG